MSFQWLWAWRETVFARDRPNSPELVANNLHLDEMLSTPVVYFQGRLVHAHAHFRSGPKPHGWATAGSQLSGAWRGRVSIPRILTLALLPALTVSGGYLLHRWVYTSWFRIKPHFSGGTTS